MKEISIILNDDNRKILRIFLEKIGLSPYIAKTMAYTMHKIDIK